MPPSLPLVESVSEPRRVGRRITWHVRAALVAIAVSLAAVFTTAAWLQPYGSDGQPLRMETHRQLGLPPCSFYQWTGLPCPSCGMTTSFALLVRGDVWNSLRANPVGTLLALLWLVLLVWSAGCAVAGQFFLVRSPERVLSWMVAGLMILLLLRWGVLLGLRALDKL